MKCNGCFVTLVTETPMEQRANIKFYVKLKKIFTKMLKFLVLVRGSRNNRCISRHTKDCYESFQMLLCTIDNIMFKILNSAHYNLMVRLIPFLEQKFDFFLDSLCISEQQIKVSHSGKFALGKFQLRRILDTQRIICTSKRGELTICHHESSETIAICEIAIRTEFAQFKFVG